MWLLSFHDTKESDLNAPAIERLRPNFSDLTHLRRLNLVFYNLTIPMSIIRDILSTAPSTVEHISISFSQAVALPTSHDENTRQWSSLAPARLPSLSKFELRVREQNTDSLEALRALWPEWRDHGVITIETRP